MATLLNLQLFSTGSITVVHALTSAFTFLPRAFGKRDMRGREVKKVFSYYPLFERLSSPEV